MNNDRTGQTPNTPEISSRRGIIKGTCLATFIGMVTKSATAAPLTTGGMQLPSAPKHVGDSLQANVQASQTQRLLDGFAVSQLILRERLARETHNYDDEEACFYPEAIVEVSWFKGTAAEFVNAGRISGPAEYGKKSVYFDSIGPASVLVSNDRAIADSACAIHTFLPLDGVEASMTSYTRLLYRARNAGGEWRIAGLRAIYIRDQLEPSNPAEIPQIDLVKLNLYRPSYRHLSYVLQANGRPLRNDLPGVDQPDAVTALRAAERRWLYGGE